MTCLMEPGRALHNHSAIAFLPRSFWLRAALATFRSAIRINWAPAMAGWEVVEERARLLGARPVAGRKRQAATEAPVQARPALVAPRAVAHRTIPADREERLSASLIPDETGRLAEA